ncbi:MAG TPA: hypothetical protein VEH82_06390, partial [Acidimicrobiales bacterium]|nr:hypothetical protein [Acidimicrobiales bacterium]
TTEHLITRQFPTSLRHWKVAEMGGFRQEMRRYWRGQLAIALGFGVVAGLVVVIGAPRLGAVLPILGDLARHQGLLAACAIGYVLLGLGLFCCQLLFTLSAPTWPLAAASVGCASLFVASGATMPYGATAAATAGLLAATWVFAVIALLGAHRAFSRADLAYYRTF